MLSPILERLRTGYQRISGTATTTASPLSPYEFPTPCPVVTYGVCCYAGGEPGGVGGQSNGALNDKSGGLNGING
eukprot:797395-Rhodomonas_salina.1